MISPGALSPPMASIAIGSISWGSPSVDVDGLATVVPPTVAAHHVGALHGAAPRARAAAGGADGPRRRASAPALRLRGLLLRDSHARVPGIGSGRAGKG